MDAFLLWYLVTMGHRAHKDDDSDFLDDIPIWALKVFAIIACLGALIALIILIRTCCASHV